MITPSLTAHRVRAAAILAALPLSLALLAQPATARAATARADAGHTVSSARAHILALARAELRRNDLNSVILSVKEGRRAIVTRALGKSMTAVPATTAMHFRIGSVAFAYLSTLLLRLRAEGRISLTDRLSRWFPKLPHSSQVTLAMLIETRPSWSCGTGEIMTSDITDLARTAQDIGTGALLSRSAYRMQTAHISRLKPGVFYGMGLFLDHGWILQNPSLNGFNAVFAYLPPRHISIAVTTTLGPRSISGHNYSTDLTRQIARYLAPGHPIS